MSNDSLDNKLKTWRGIEPSPTFEQDVWRRIRTQPKKVSFFDFLSARPLYASAAAIVAGILLGFVVEQTIHQPKNITLLALNRPGTISGDYAHALTGGSL